MVNVTKHECSTGDKTISYLEAGPHDGPLLVFIHGWPGVAETWQPQIETFAGLGFRVVSPDMPGYGQSTITKNKRDYSLESIVNQLLGLLKHLERSEAIWIGHDWGAAVVWSLVAHAPEASLGVVGMCVPYRTIELGLDELISLSNRDIYPEADYPNAQWDYQAYYQKEETFAKSVAYYETDIPNTIKYFYSKGSPDAIGKPTFTSELTKTDGFFGGQQPPPAPLEISVLDADLHAKIASKLAAGGYWAPTAYYLNHDVNRAYTLDHSKNEGVLSMPVLFVEARYDTICSIYESPRLGEPMRNHCRKYSEAKIDAGHWVALEKPEEVNAAILRWIALEVPTAYPYAKLRGY